MCLVGRKISISGRDYVGLTEGIDLSHILENS